MAIGPPAKGFLRILALPLHQNALTFYSVPAVAAVEANEVPEAEQNLRWKMTVKWPNDARQMWLDLGNAPDGTLKNRLYQTGTRLMDSIAEEEYFLKTVSPKVSEGEILVPNALDPSQTRQKLAELCRNRIPYHKRWRTLSVAGLPFSTAAGLVPGPNVFLLYNGFRLYSHHLAFSHALHLLDLLEKDAISTSVSEDLTKAYGPWTRSEVISDAVLTNLSNVVSDGGGGNDFYHHVDRARKQLLKRTAQT